MPLPKKSRYTIFEAAKYIAAAAGETVNSGQVLDWAVQGSYRLHLAVDTCTVMREGKKETLRDCLVEIRLSAEQAAKLARGERVSAAHCWRDGNEWEFVRQRNGDYHGWRGQSVYFGFAALAVVGSELAAFGASLEAPPMEPTAPAQQLDTQPQSTSAPEDTPWHLLATPIELIAAFGTFTGMDKAWFNNAKDAPKLKAALHTAGQGGRNGREPLYFVFPIMQWLIDAKRRKGNPMSEATGWRVLKNQFSKVYAEFQDQDPTAD